MQPEGAICGARKSRGGICERPVSQQGMRCQWHRNQYSGNVSTADICEIVEIFRGRIIKSLDRADAAKDERSRLAHERSARQWAREISTLTKTMNIEYDPPQENDDEDAE